ncbi:MAG: YbaB/EbfC family nucleoid-associated protein [Alphaproteobacteria bacterium]|nr:YbaB/EbfC family nucleoid-associated protein [Alphaproteobacteria bacterium]
MMELADLFQQAKAMQEKAAAMQAELERLEVDGVAGGGLVRVTMTGKSELKRVSIDPSLFVAEERQVVEDLIVAAAGDAKAKVERRLADEMQKLTGGLGLPPGFKMPGL